jgi:3-hydroxymyristoyl/3-hydroxydecanoyl-(acyl carrier protein) dehydratase
MTFELRRVIGADHPSLPGHFPGEPIVPGVVILDEIIAALNEWRADSRLAAIQSVKFLRPLKPAQPFTIHLTANDQSQNQIDFSVRVDDQLIVEGRLELASSPS